jgi:hypothetical protein
LKRTAKVAVVCALVVVAVAVFVLPTIPMSASTNQLLIQHGQCGGGEFSNISFYASGSYAVFGEGLVYIPHGGYLWWLPQPQNTSSCPLIA